MLPLSLQDIFNTITPSNLLKIPLIKTAQEIFLKSLEQNSKVSIRISNIFDIDKRSTDTIAQARARANLRYAFYMSYIGVLWKYVNAIASDIQLRESLEQYGYTNSKLYQDVDSLLNSEFIQAHREYTQYVGTEKGTRYMYALALYLEQGVIEDDLEVNELTPFVTNYQGKLGRRIYNEFTHPLSQPCSWVDYYETLFKVTFQDYFGIEVTDEYTELMINCKDLWVVFNDSSDDGLIVNKFLGMINPRTMQRFTRQEIKEQVAIIPNKVVATYRKYTDTDDNTINVFVFQDDTVFWHNETLPKKSIYTTYSDYLKGFVKPLLEWGDCYNLSYEQHYNFTFLYQDKVTTLKDLLITWIKEESNGLGDYSCFNINDLSKMFRVQGHEMLLMPGLDESTKSSSNGKDVADSFNAEFKVNLRSSSNVCLQDAYGNTKTFEKVSKDTLKYNTHGFSGTEYTITMNDLLFGKVSIFASGLNNRLRRDQIRDVSITPGMIEFKGYIFDKDLTELKRVVRFTSLQRSPLKNQDYYLECIWDIDGVKTKKYLDISDNTSLYFDFVFTLNQKQRRYKLVINRYRYTGKLISSEYYGGTNVIAYYFSPVLNYPNPIASYKGITELDKPADNPYFSEFVPEALRPIGEKDNGEFYPALSFKDSLDYDHDIFWDGNIGYGIRYANSHWDRLPNDSVFINLGFTKQCLPTSDYYQYLNDGDNTDLEIDIEIETASKGYYLYTNDGRYFTSKDGYYLFSTNADYQGLYLVITLPDREVKIPKGITLLVAQNYLGVPNKEGFKFVGWSLTQDGDALPNSYTFNHDMPLYPVYTGKDILLTFSTNRGEFNS